MKERNNPLLKKLDRYIGIPLVYTLGLFHRRHPLPDLKDKDKAYHFVLIMVAAIGDTILSSAIIRELRACYPQCRITLVCSQSNAAMAELLRGVDRVQVFNMHRPAASLLQLKEIPHADILLDFAPWARINAVISWKTDASYKIGFYRKNMYRHYIYDKSVKHRDDCHELDNYRHLLSAMGMPVHGYCPQILPQADFDVSSAVQGKYVVFHLFPGGSCVPLRSWQNEKWIGLGRRIQENYGYTVVLTGGMEDIESANRMVEKMQKENLPAVSLAGKISLDEVNGLLRQAELLVTVNTGIMHLGAAVDVPMIALHGATDYRRWGPVSRKAVVVRSEETCQPCLSLGFESNCRDPICMKHITVDMVWEKMKQILDSGSVHRQ